MATVSKTDKVPENNQVQPDALQELMAQMEQMRAELDSRFRALEEREAALKAKEEAAKPAVAKPRERDVVLSDAWDDKNAREIFLPYATAGEEQFVYVSVNGMKYQVPRGVPVKVPLPLHERLIIMQEAHARTVRYRDSLPNQAAPQQAVRVG